MPSHCAAMVLQSPHEVVGRAVIALKPEDMPRAQLLYRVESAATGAEEAEYCLLLVAEIERRAARAACADASHYFELYRRHILELRRPVSSGIPSLHSPCFWD